MKTRVIILVSLFLASIAAHATGSLSQGRTPAGESLNAATVDERLWATWGLETVEITTGGVSNSYALEVLLADREKLPRNLFVSLYFFDDQVGACSSEEDFAYKFNINVKGSFSTSNGQLTVTLYERQPRTFAYTFEDGYLKIRYTQGETQYDLIYKRAS